jgi:tetratricopeptide (TPR) repeat protein
VSIPSHLSRLAVIALLATASLDARAQEPDDSRAQELYDNGVLLYEEGRYDEAILAWQEAYKISKRPLLFFNMANASERLGEYQEAIDHLNHYRAYAAADEREALDRRIKNLERRFDEQQVDGSGSAVAGTNGSPGTGQPVTPVPASLSSAVPAPAPEPGANLSAASPGPGGGGPPPLQSPRRGPRPAPLVMYSVGGVGLAAGGTFAALALSSRNQAGSLCVADGRRTWCPQAAQTHIQRDQVFSVLADIGFALGISGTLGGSVSLVAGPRAADVTGRF